MSFVSSALFGSEGSYNILGVDVKFKEKTPIEMSTEMSTLDGAGLISTLAQAIIGSTIFRLASQGYLHVFVHEMGHALSFGLFKNQNTTVTIHQDTCTGVTDYPSTTGKIARWKNSVISAAGPMTNMAFSACKLVAITH